MDRLARIMLRIGHRLALAYWFVARPRVEGAYVAVWHGEQVLLIRNSYRRAYSLPAGGPKRGESLAETAARELFEEVGVRAPLSALQMTRRFFTDSEFRQDHSAVFELRVDSRPQIRVDGREVIEAEFVTQEDAVRRTLTPIVSQYFAWKAKSDSASELGPGPRVHLTHDD